MKNLNIKLVLLTVCFVVLLPSVLSAQEPIESWVDRYNGPGNWLDEAYDIVVDADGNVYVTGFSYGSGTSSDYATIKYNPDGERQWVRRYNSLENNSDVANVMAVDAAGNVYVTGRSNKIETSSDYATIKYNPDGERQWVRRYDGPGNSFDEATDIAIDADGNVYVTGISGYGYATIKYNPDGERQWVRLYNGYASMFFNLVPAIAVDSSNNIYVTGRSVTSDYVTIKYDNAGTQQWVMQYNGPWGSFDEATDIAIDTDGNVYVTGWSWSGGGGVFDYATVKYNTYGIQQWVAQYDRHPIDNATAIAVDADGNVYVTGLNMGMGECRYATVKYDDTGTQQWARDYPCSVMTPPDITVDTSGNVYVTGSSYDNYATIKYDNAGTQQWVMQYNGPGNNSDSSFAIAVDACGNVYVTGFSYGSGTSSDYATIKYSPDSDGDGVPDDQDACPSEDATGYDANEDGCIDTIGGLSQLIQTLVDEGIIDEQLQNSLLSKVANAEKSSDKENICAAVNQLEAFINEINAQRGKKISEEAADLVIAYVNNIITTLLGPLPPGESC